MGRRHRFEDEQATVAQIVRPLVDGGALEPLADRDADAQLWMDCELCSFVENRFHQPLEPASITRDSRELWSRRGLAPDERLWDPRRSEYAAAFWIADRGVRVGTIAVTRMLVGRMFLPISSLYVFPGHRAGGLGYRSLRAVHQSAVAAGLAGIRLSTFWTWQAAVRRYLFRYGMWAWSFKRSIELAWVRDLPPYTVTIGDDAARFAVDQDTGTVELLAAARDGELLIWNELPAMSCAALDASLRFHARSTFAVALAVSGWPLVRAGDDLDEAAVADIGGPDVLAHKIAVFEALDRRNGFEVRTPRIPGVPYEAIARALAGDRDAPDPYSA